MKKETKGRLNERILQFLNRWLKAGREVQNRDAFFARGEIEQMISEVYLEGRKDVCDEIEFETLKRSLK